MTGRWRSLTLGAVVALTAASRAGAQTYVLDFSGLGLPNYGQIPLNYGSVGGILDVTNSTRNGFGNSSLASCGPVEYWQANYSDLTDIAFRVTTAVSANFYFSRSAGVPFF
jgi:hypothetical protein